MNIHNTMEVRENEVSKHAQRFTKDRLGKQHEVDKKQKGFAEPWILKFILFAPIIALAFFLILATRLHAAEEPKAASKGPNTQYTSDELEKRSLDERLNDEQKEERFSAAISDSASLGFDDDGNPNVGMRF